MYPFKKHESFTKHSNPVSYPKLNSPLSPDKIQKKAKSVSSFLKPNQPNLFQLRQKQKEANRKTTFSSPNGVVQGYFEEGFTRGQISDLATGMRALDIDEATIQNFYDYAMDSQTNYGPLDCWMLQHTDHTYEEFFAAAKSSNKTRVLLGEGSFGFAARFAEQHFGTQDKGSRTKIIPTSYEPSDDEIFQNEQAQERLSYLEERGFVPMFGIDATRIHENPDITELAPDEVQFNCPRIQGRPSGYSTKQLITGCLDSAAQIPSVESVYITIPHRTSYSQDQRRGRQTVRQIYGVHESSSFEQEKIKPDPYDEYGFKHEITGTNSPRENLSARTYKFRRTPSDRPNQDHRLFIGTGLKDASDVEDDSDFGD